MRFLPFFRMAGLAALLSGLPPAGAAESLLKEHPLDGDVETTYWTFLASQNLYLLSDLPAEMTGVMTVAAPGYGAGMGLYSWTGAYSMTVSQSSSAFDIQHAVFQLDATWDPAVTFPINGGPVLSYNGGNQQLRATLPMLVDGMRVVENETGVPEMEGIESFSYRGITWQWDLSEIADVIHSVRIHMPLANHTSVVGARIDVASDFLQIGGDAVTPIGLWRQTHFQTTANSGTAADGADHDGDGLSNLIEYALGTDPTSGEGINGPGAAPTPDLADGRLAVSFSIPASSPAELTYRVQASNGLDGWKTIAIKASTAPWSWLGEGPSRISAVPSPEKVYLRVGDEVSSHEAPRRMMRLSVSY